MNLLEQMLQAQRQHRPYALITVVQAQGPAPRDVGSKMLVFADGQTVGSIGGNLSEKQAVEEAMTCIAQGTHALRTYDLHAQDGNQQGAQITVFIEASRFAPVLVVCGGGHVGAQVLALGRTLGFETVLVDDRDRKVIARAIEHADCFVPVTDYRSGVEQLPVAPGAYFVLCSWGHAQDQDALSGALQKQAAYIGMLGGKPKIRQIFAALREQGVTQRALDEVCTPIGLDLGAQTPAEVAVSIMSEILTVRTGASGKRLSQGK